VAFAFRAPVDWEPLVAFEPVQAPEAAHDVAWLDDQVRVDAAPLATVLGLALKLTTTDGVDVTVTVADCTALPPVPLQVKE
jgi:hypothetical protein